MFGSRSELLPLNKPEGVSEDHTHRWTVYIRGVDNEDVTYWLKKVQFKLHETYSQSLRTIEAPGPFEVTETGWGEFEVTIKLFFAPEAGEKAQSIYHQLKLHHYGEDKEAREAAKARGDPVVSQQYEEIIFNEPSEAFYEILTSDPPVTGRGKGGSKSAKNKRVANRTADIPEMNSSDNFTRKAELEELARINRAQKEVETLLEQERALIVEREKELNELRKSEGAVKSK